MLTIKSNFRILQIQKNHQNYPRTKNYSLNKKRFRNGMKQLLKSRAHNIMRVAFVKGLKLNWHHISTDKNMMKAAELMDKMKYMRKVFI